MVIGIFGESCTGKSVISERLKEKLSATVYTGKDYLRFDKQESIAIKKFKDLLEEKCEGNDDIIYVISEKEHLVLLPEECIRVLITDDIEVIKERFSKRMGGKMPQPVATMLERKHGIFDNEKCNFHIESREKSIDEVCTEIISLRNKF